MPAPPASSLDQQQILQRVFDEAQGKLRTDASVTVGNITAEVEVEIDAADGDNIAIASADGSKKVTVTTVGAVEALDVNVANTQIITAASPLITNVNAAVSGTEYNYAIPANTKRFSIKVRGTATMNVAYIAGTTGTTYLQVPVGTEYIEQNLALAGSLPIYFQTNKNAQVVEIITWA